jgi:flagellar biosynthesis regulator FlbT
VLITSLDIYYYTVMPFGLNNAGATYQCMANRMFKEHINKTVEIYIDDIIVKSKKVHSHLTDLKNTFEILRKHRLRCEDFGGQKEKGYCS